MNLKENPDPGKGIGHDFECRLISSCFCRWPLFVRRVIYRVRRSDY